MFFLSFCVLWTHCAFFPVLSLLHNRHICVVFLYYLPINYSISSTIIIIYQTGLIFVGAIVAYKTVFKRRNLFFKALDNCKEQGEQMQTK